MIELPYYEIKQAVRLAELGHVVWVYCRAGKTPERLRDELNVEVIRSTKRPIELAPRAWPPDGLEVHAVKPGVLVRPFDPKELVTLIHPYDLAELIRGTPAVDLNFSAADHDPNEIILNGKRYYQTTAVKPRTKVFA